MLNFRIAFQILIAAEAFQASLLVKVLWLRGLNLWWWYSKNIIELRKFLLYSIDLNQLLPIKQRLLVNFLKLFQAPLQFLLFGFFVKYIVHQLLSRIIIEDIRLGSGQCHVWRLSIVHFRLLSFVCWWHKAGLNWGWRLHKHRELRRFLVRNRSLSKT